MKAAAPIARLTLGAPVALALSLSCATSKEQAPPAATDQPPIADSEDTSALGPVGQMLAQQKQPKDFIEFFRGTFEKLAIRLDSGEELTAHHLGDRFTLTPGLDKTADFTVDLKVQNLENLVGFADDEKIDDGEATRIMAVLFTPLTEAALMHPVTSDNNLRKASGVEDHIHTYLIGADGAEVASHTLVYENDKWTVTPGIHGEAARVFRINWRQAVDYQRKAFEAKKKDSPAGWMEFATWYKDWREQVSTTSAKG